jgi:spore coat polysaccharide biosynthesis predicted glycosyltransferase SpsG
LKVLILTGGSDVAKLSRTLPVQLNESLGKNVELHWVRGPFSEPPILPDECRLEWHVHDAPTQLDELIVHSDYVLTVFGVSLFEVLQYGIPSVVFSPYGDKDDIELTSLSDNAQSAVDNLIKLMNNDKLAREYSTNALNKLSVNGAQKLSEEIYSLIGV